MGVRGRGVWWACAPAAAIVAAAFLLGAGAGGAVSLATCTDSQLVPRVAELLVSQGAPGYTAAGYRLARGKETIVRAYLTTPSACSLSNKQSITPISATLDVTNGDTAPAPAQLTNYVPLSGKLSSSTAQIYPTSDPFFVVPSSYLAPTSTTNSFSITFKLKITYSRNGSTSYLSTDPATTPNSSANPPVDQKTNALRVLVVPMGDPTSTNTQWSPAADSTFQSIMTNTARAYPVPTGATPSLTLTTTGGIRYLMGTTLLDVKSLGLYPSGASKFCGTGANWSTSQVTSGALSGHTLKGDLLQRLADYNLYNNPPADLVLGVIDGNIAFKSTDGLGCDDGRAATPISGATGQVGWVRVSTDALYPSPVQMELMHPFGISKTLSFHSPNVEADGAEPDHGYNVIQRKVISAVSGALGKNDHSIMNYNTSTGIPYAPDNTLLEPKDWKDALCDLGGVDSNAVGATPAFASCTLSSALGASQGIGAGRSFYQISGILKSGGVRVTMAKANQPGRAQTGVTCKTLDTFDTTNSLPLCATNPSSVHLLLCTGSCSATNFSKDVGLAVLPDEGHDGEPPDPNSPPDPGSPNGFSALVEMDSGWTDAALMLNGTTLVPIGSVNDAGPQILSTSTGEAATILRSFPMPVSGNGRAIAFDGTYLYTTVVGDSKVYKLTTSGSSVSTFDVGTTLGALAFNGGYFYGGDYTTGGSVYKIDPANPGAKTTLFTFSDDGPCIGSGNFIDGLEYLPTDKVAISGDACNRVFIKGLPGGSAISDFSTTNNSGITTDGAGGLWLALLTHGNAAYTELTHVDAAGHLLGNPIILSGYAAEDLAYDSVTFPSKCVVWTNQATFAETTAEIRAVEVPCSGGMTTSSSQEVAVQTTNTSFVSLFFTCRDLSNPDDDRPVFPLANGLQPDASGEVIAAYSSQLFCGGTGTSPKIISEASNGWTSTGLTGQNAVAPVNATARDPIVNIASPLNGAKYRRGEFVHYDGSATDAQQSAIVAGLKWYFDGALITPEGTGQPSFDKKLTATTPLGNHTIKLEATDSQGKVGSATVTITVGPALCPSTSKCP